MSQDHDEQTNPRKDAARLAREVEANDIKWLTGNKQGRRIVWGLLAKAGVYRTSFTGNSETFFNEGKRAIGLGLLNDVTQHAPENYLLMHVENTKAQA